MTRGWNSHASMWCHLTNNRTAENLLLFPDDLYLRCSNRRRLWGVEHNMAHEFPWKLAFFLRFRKKRNMPLIWPFEVEVAITLIVLSTPRVKTHLSIIYKKHPIIKIYITRLVVGYFDVCLFILHPKKINNYKHLMK